MSADDHADESTPNLEPRPLRARPFLQVAAWLSGIAGGVVFMSLLTISTSRCSGATKAVRLKWQQRLHGVPQNTAAADQAQTNAELCPPSTVDETSAERPTRPPAEAKPWNKRQHNSTTNSNRP